MKISDISEATLPASLQGLGQLNTISAIKRGSNNASEVKRVQRTLNSFGYGLEEDGVFGPATENAVKAVQKKLGLIATGVWDTVTAEKVNGVTKSGIINASVADRAAVAVRQAPPASQQTIDSTATAMTYGSAAPSFLDTLQARMKAFIASPNYPYYLVGGIVVVGAAAYLLLGGKSTKLAEKPVALGLGRLRSTKKRKSAKRKSKKSTKTIYVNFATTPKGPFLTESFTSMSSAQKAVREARAAGETARIAGR